ncbi:MAG: hypothetical protein ACFFCO_11100, partial [Promethearchaeota archaeon]
SLFLLSFGSFRHDIYLEAVIIFNLYGTDFVTDWTGGLIKLSTLMMIISLAIAVVLLLHLMWKSSFGRSQIYCAIVIVLVLLSSPVGVWHHRFIEIFPAFFAGLVVHHHFRRRSASQRAQNSTGT